MPLLEVKKQEDILLALITSVVANTDLSDVTDSSSVKHLLAAFARQLDELYYQLVNALDLFSIDTARGDDLDERAKDVQPALITRNLATKATGNVVFSRSGTTGLVNIASGTRVKTAGGVEFETTAAGTIADGGSSSGNVAAIAVEAGADGNVAASTIVKFVSKPSGVDSVTNPAVFVGGTDKESDDAFRARIRAFIATLPRCTLQAYEFAAEEVSISSGKRVVSAHAVEDEENRGEVTLYIDDGSGTASEVQAFTGEIVTEGLGGGTGDSAVGGERRLFLNNKPVRDDLAFTLTSDTRGALTRGTHFLLDPASGQIDFTPVLSANEQITCSYTAYIGLVAEVQKVIYGDPADRTNYPGWKAAGTRVTVTVPAVLVQEVEASVTILEGHDDATVFAAVEAAIIDYINNLGISGDVLRAELFERIMAVDGVYNVSLIKPASDVTISDDELPRIETSNITLN